MLQKILSSIEMKRLLAPLAILLLATISISRAEMQGAWISSVHNINFPSKQGLSVEEQKSQAVRLLDAAKGAGLNAILLQVRPESDALYASPLEPWSRFLTGKQGQSPGYDPLAFFIGEARERGLEVHAWINPYRAAANVSHPRAASHISRRFPNYAYRIGTVLYMDPGAPEVRRHIHAVVRDLVTRYDIAGVHLDDYFYPACPTSPMTEPTPHTALPEADSPRPIGAAKMSTPSSANSAKSFTPRAPDSSSASAPSVFTPKAPRPMSKPALINTTSSSPTPLLG